MSCFPDWASDCLKRLKAHGFQGYFIGGCVRDLLLGHPFHDIDIATNARPEEVIACYPDTPVIKTGLKHGTVTVLWDLRPVEITTFRSDGIYTDHRRPDQVFFSQSLQEDTARRDFTVNALASDENGCITDLHGGKKDLERGIIRCVGEADRRFQEDALRMLRALRFASVLSFTVEPETAAAIHRNRELLSAVSAERVMSELIRLLCGENVEKILLEYTDVLGVVLPELLPLKGFDQHNPNHVYDVLGHTAKAVSAIAPVPVLRLAALFHDIGKPACFSLDPDGIGHFYGHAPIGAAIAEHCLQRLKADRQTETAVTTLVKHHHSVLEADERLLKRRLNKFGPDGVKMLLALQRADTSALAPSFSVPRMPLFDRVEEMIEKLISQKACFSLKDLAVNGDDMTELGLQGREIGAALEHLLSSVIDEKLPNERVALLKEAEAIHKKLV